MVTALLLSLTLTSKVAFLEGSIDTLREHKNLVNAATANYYTLDMREPSNLTPYHLEMALKGTGLEGLGSSFAKAEVDYGVNALCLIGIAWNESAAGTSGFAVSRNNLFGWGAYTEDPSQALSFPSKSDCIDTVAKFLACRYLQEDGLYFGGYTLEGVNKCYAADPYWANKAAFYASSCGKAIYEEVTTNANIPATNFFN